MGKEAGEEDEEDGNLNKMMVLGDAGGAAMRAGAVLRVAPASSAAAAERMQAISSGCGFVAGRCKGPAGIRQPGGPTWSAAVCWGAVGLWTLPVGLGWAGLLQFARV